ncbi:hypothetical protein DDP45_03100 [Helicobacter pylori]|nr:hypothetical protein DDP36_03330 [Helicobacter pylori]RDY81264.1 hypothetical protein DDP35_02880 [Helicobacter pylori]RDY81275.1 hypothetical protein DDP45_03100 [Helicobacter pylori]
MFVIFCPTSRVSVCASNKRGSVLVGALKRFKQKSHSPKPIKTYFFQPTYILIRLSLFIASC